jgi:hypothetical protein
MVKKKGLVYEFVLDERRIKRLKNLGYSIECFLCRIPFNKGETVIHKGKRLYHPKCYELVWHDIPDSILDEEDIFFIEHGEYLEIKSSSTLTIPSISTIPTYND